MKTVKISAHPETNVVVSKQPNLGKDGKQYGFIIVTSEEQTFDGFARNVKRSAVIPGLFSDLEKMNLFAGKEISGKIVNTEALSAFPGAQPVINPTTKQPVLVNGQQLYRKSTFTSDLNAQDVLVARNTAPVQSASLLGNVKLTA